MAFSVMFAGAIFVLVEVPWLNTEKLFMGTLQGCLAPAKKAAKDGTANLDQQLTATTTATDLEQEPKKAENKV